MEKLKDILELKGEDFFEFNGNLYIGDIDLSREDYASDNGGYDSFAEFIEDNRADIAYDVEEFNYCEDCGEISDDMEEAEGGDIICSKCAEEKYTVCDDCGLYVKETTEVIGGDCVCNTCIDDKYASCDDCGKYELTGYMLCADNITVCSKCSDNYSECQDCNKAYRSEDMHIYNDEPLCERCYDSSYITCDDCGYVEHADNSHRTHNDRWICRSCREDNYFVCDECDELYHTEDEYYDEYNERSYCCNCHDGSSHGSCQIHDYSYKPSKWNMVGTGCKVGIEVEVVSRGSRAEASDETYEALENEIGSDNFMFKEDGSLPSGGFEIVTHPMGLDYVEKFGKALYSVREHIKAYHASNCGIHIHIAKKDFGECDNSRKLHIAKYLLFFAKNREFIETIAQRGTTNYWCHEKSGAACAAKASRGNGNRYEAVNLQNRDTIEVRIFRSNIAEDAVLRDSQFVLSLKDFAKKATLKKLTHQHYIEWLDKNDGNEALKKFIARKWKDGSEVEESCEEQEVNNQ